MPNWEKGLIAIAINLVLIIILFKVIDVIDRRVRLKIQNEESNSPLLRFIPIIMKLLKAVLLFIAFTGFLQSQGYSVSSILAGFGIGGIAVGMAAKDALANIFGSIEILSDHVYKVGDYVNFVGTIDIENGQIKLSKISTEEINYNSSTKLELNELIDNIKLVKNTYFIVSGYLVTEGEVYKLFDSKDDYTENNKAGYYFKIKWDGSFGYTGKQQVSLKCNLSSSYTLVNCTLSE